MSRRTRSGCSSTTSLPIVRIPSSNPFTAGLTGIDHFHVHVVHIDHEGLAGMTVGQAHLLDDLISLVRLVSSYCGKNSADQLA